MMKTLQKSETLVILLLAGALYYFPGSARGSGLEFPDAGRFRVGFQLGTERAGFSGLPMVMVFTHAADPGWPAIRACLQSSLIEVEMQHFTGVLVHEIEEPAVEQAFRQRGLRVIARDLNGAFLGGLPADFTCLQLAALLQTIRAGRTGSPDKSPVYANLLENPYLVSDLASQLGCARAATFVDFFAEFEGSSHPKVIIAKDQLRTSCGLVFFQRGDGNADGTLDISDPIAALGYLFSGIPAAICEEAADSNDDGDLDVTDAVFSLEFLFLDGPVPPPPFCRCGFDPTPDLLDCKLPAPCE